MNGDGTQDIVAANIGEKNRIYLNQGNGKFEEFITFGSLRDKTMSIALGDLDGDGDLDIVTGNNNSKNHYYINSGEKFKLNYFSEDNKITYGISLGDLNNNGRLDVIESNSGDVNKIFFNKAMK